MDVDIKGKVEVKFVEKGKVDVESMLWYITLLDNVITLFSNGSYLCYDENKKKVEGYQYMKRWICEKEDEQYYLYYENKNNRLTISGEDAVIENEIKKDDQLFEFVDENINI